MLATKLGILLWRYQRGGAAVVKEGKGARGEDEVLFWKMAALQGPAPDISCISGALQHFGAVSGH